jgi:hypothetical protein
MIPLRTAKVNLRDLVLTENSNPNVMVMQAAQNWHRDHAAGAPGSLENLVHP